MNLLALEGKRFLHNKIYAIDYRSTQYRDTMNRDHTKREILGTFKKYISS